MTNKDLASAKLMSMVNDVDAQTLFDMGGPLAWFSLKRTYASAYMKGGLTEKQIKLVTSVYDQYARLSGISHGFIETGIPEA